MKKVVDSSMWLVIAGVGFGSTVLLIAVTMLDWPKMSTGLKTVKSAFIAMCLTLDYSLVEAFNVGSPAEGVRMWLVLACFVFVAVASVLRLRENIDNGHRHAYHDQATQPVEETRPVRGEALPPAVDLSASDGD